MRLQADRVDAGVRPAAAGHLSQRLEHVLVLEVERLGAGLRVRQPQPLGDAIDRDHALRAEQERAA